VSAGVGAALIHLCAALFVVALLFSMHSVACTSQSLPVRYAHCAHHAVCSIIQYGFAGSTGLQVCFAPNQGLWVIDSGYVSPNGTVSAFMSAVRFLSQCVCVAILLEWVLAGSESQPEVRV
jgi:hypothetical protein